MKAYTWCNKHPDQKVPNYDRTARCPVCNDFLDKEPELPKEDIVEPIELDLD